MYQFVSDDIINVDFILNNYSQEEIFSIVFGRFKVEEYMISPFRKDNYAGCFIQYYNNKLWFVDFGDSNHHRDCFEIIMDKYKLTLQESCLFIHNYFKSFKRPTIADYSEVKYKSKKSKNNFDIEFKVRNFNIQDQKYWTQFYIKKQQLIEDNVFPLIWYKTKGFFPNDFVVRPDDIAYAYTDFISKNVKIYRPLTKVKKHKWFTNCNQNDIGSLSKLPETGKDLLITKSYKDCRIIRNQGFNSIWFQNEVCVPDISILYNFHLRFQNIYTLFDNDRQGVEYSIKIKEVFKTNFNSDIKNIFIPDENCKDSGMYIKKINEFQFKKFLKNQVT